MAGPKLDVLFPRKLEELQKVGIPRASLFALRTAFPRLSKCHLGDAGRSGQLFFEWLLSLFQAVTSHQLLFGALSQSVQVRAVCLPGKFARERTCPAACHGPQR